MSTIKDFSGGLNTRLHPQMIGLNQSTEYTNCDNEQGILKPTKGITPTNIVAGPRWKYFNYCDEVVYSNSETYWAEYDTYIYFTTPAGISKRDCLGNISNATIPSGPTKPTVANSGAGTLKGKYRYVYTYYNNTNGVESAPTPLSDELDIPDSGGQVTVSNILASSDPQTTHIRLYRIGGVIPQYNLVVQLNNINQPYVDNSSDTLIAGNDVLESFTYSTPPANPLYLTEHLAMLFTVVGTKLYFSDVAKPHAWPKTNFLEFDKPITGLGATQNGLLVFTRYKTYIVTGNNPVTLSKYLLSGDQGCVSHDTIAFADNTLMWLSTDGVCISQGGNIDVITQALLGRLTAATIKNAVVFDKMYLLGIDDVTYILDSRYGFAIRKLDYSGWFGVYKDNLYLERGGKLQKMFSGALDTMYYQSPVFTEGRLSEYKMFKDIYVAFSGDIHMTITLHTHQAPYAIVVFDDILLPTEVQQDIKTRGSEMGYGISFKITGVGEVHEIDFKASGRENGK